MPEKRPSKRVRFEVFKRDRFTCVYCGRRPPEVILQADHLVPRCEGGSADVANLVTACAACNNGKGGRPLGAVMPPVDEMALLASMQEAMERASALRKAAAAAEAKKQAEDEAVDMVADWYEEAIGSTDHFEDRSILRFLQEIDFDDIRDAVDSTGRAVRARRMSSKRAWLYFCAACWKKVRAARGEAEDDDAS